MFNICYSICRGWDITVNKTFLSEGIFNVCSSICRGCDLAVRIYEGCLAQWSFYFLVQIGGLQGQLRNGGILYNGYLKVFHRLFADLCCICHNSDCGKASAENQPFLIHVFEQALLSLVISVDQLISWISNSWAPLLKLLAFQSHPCFSLTRLWSHH